MFTMQLTQMNKKAFALSITLWIVAAILFGIATLGTFSKDIQFLTNALDAKLKTELICDNILEAVKFYTLTADYDSRSLINNNLTDFKYHFPNKIILDNRWYQIDKNIRLRVIDTSGMINVFRVSPLIIASFLATNSQKQQKYTIIDSINDWEDIDNIVNLNGAEQARYTFKKQKTFTVRNSFAIQDINELQLINGIDSIDEKLWSNLKSRLYYGEISTTNLALVDSTYLSKLLNINISKAESFISLRENNLDIFISQISKEKIFDATSMGFHLSFQFKIEIEVSIDSAKSNLISLIYFTPKKSTVYTQIQYILQ